MSHEFERIAWIQRHLRPAGGAGTLTLGPGDDASVWQPPPGESLVTTVDALVEGSHFRPGWMTPRVLGARAVEVAASDLAAMGARPAGVCLALSLPDSLGQEDFEAMFEGILEATSRQKLDVWGGNLARGPLQLSVTVFGTTGSRPPLRRDGARDGDDLWVTGQPGRASAGRELLLAGLTAGGGDELRSVEKFCEPRARIAEILALREQVELRSAIDLSDGLARDLEHVLEASSPPGSEPLVAILEEERLTGLVGLRPGGGHRLVPDEAAARQHALEGGEDYEVLFSSSPEDRATLEELAGLLPVPLTRIGKITRSPVSGPEIWIESADGERARWTSRGFDHFRQED